MFSDQKMDECGPTNLVLNRKNVQIIKSRHAARVSYMQFPYIIALRTPFS